MNRKANRLAIFDLDGTLLDTIGDLAAACNHMLALRGLGLHTREEYTKMVGNGVLNLVTRALPEELRTPDYIEAARQDFLEYYVAHIDCFTQPYDGIREVLSQLQRDGWTMAVASNKFHEGTKVLVENIFSDIDFKVVYGNREGFPLKPDKALLDLIIAECGATVETTVMIGDSGIDMQTAKNAGVRSIGCSWGFRPREDLETNGADHIINRPIELLDILNQLNS